jgi:hypothetical protein
MPLPEPRILPPEEQTRLVDRLRNGLTEAREGRRLEAERLFRGVLGEVRGTGQRAERLALQHLARLFVHERRELESLCIARRLAALSRAASDDESLAFAHAAGAGALAFLEDWDRFDEEADALGRALGTYQGAQRPALLRHLHRLRARRELARGDVAAARNEMESVAAVGGGPDEPATARFSHLVEALVELAADRPREARAALDRAEAVENAGAVHRLLAAYIAARCAVEIDGPEAGRAAIERALEIAEAGGDGAASRLRRTKLLAELAERDCGAPELAKRAYESAAAAALMRAGEIARVVREIPELAGENVEDVNTLTAYRRRFVAEQTKVLEAVAPLLAAEIAAGENPVWTRKSLEHAVGVCAWCLRVRLPDGSLIPLGHFLPQEAGLRVTHGLCGPCSVRLSNPSRTEAPRIDLKP